MKKIIAGIFLLVAGLLFFNGCGVSASAQPIKPTWVKPEMGSSTAALPISELEKNRMSHFYVGTSSGNLAFMAYQFEGRLYARASICPPCRSQSFSLVGDTLVCDSCATVFQASTGKGVKGPCVAYSKAEVKYEVTDGKMVMKAEDLLTAYQETLKADTP